LRRVAWLGLAMALAITGACKPAQRDPFLGTWRLDNEATIRRAKADGLSASEIIFLDGMHDDDRVALDADEYSAYSASDPQQRKTTSYRVIREAGGCREIEFTLDPPLPARLCAVDGRLNVEVSGMPGDMVMVYRRD
jgi:hypothetical protein